MHVTNDDDSGAFSWRESVVRLLALASNLERASAQGDLLTGDDRWKAEDPATLATWHSRAANLEIETLGLVASIQERVADRKFKLRVPWVR